MNKQSELKGPGQHTSGLPWHHKREESLFSDGKHNLLRTKTWQKLKHTIKGWLSLTGNSSLSIVNLSRGRMEIEEDQVKKGTTLCCNFEDSG